MLNDSNNIILTFNLLRSVKKELNSVASNESERGMELIDVNAYIAEKIAKAIEKAKTRTAPYTKPKWWKDDINGSWLNCMATASSNFGDDSVVTGYESFAENHEQYGFRRLNGDEKLEHGDIISYYNDLGYPHHSVMYVGDDEAGKRLVSYGRGDDSYGYANSIEDWFQSQGEPYRAYRFVGKPSELAKIAEHNAHVKEQDKRVYGNENGKPAPLPSQIKLIPVERKEAKLSKEELETLKFLSRIKKR